VAEREELFTGSLVTSVFFFFFFSCATKDECNNKLIKLKFSLKEITLFDKKSWVEKHVA